MSTRVLYFDGGNHCNRICVYDPYVDKHIVKVIKTAVTNNELEYWALISAIRYAKRLYKGQCVVFLGDSALVINQVWGKWRINKEKLRILNRIVIKELTNLQDCNGRWVRREINKAGIHLENLLNIDKKDKSNCK